MFCRILPLRFPVFCVIVSSLSALLGLSHEAFAAPGRQQILETMKAASRVMVERYSHEGGYVWYTRADLSRRWGELEASPSMVWVQGPGTPAMGQLLLDAYHATGDEYYYAAAEKAALALVRGQLACGGWNYVIDFAGETSLRKWYDTVAKNAWRMEEFQHYYGNATFDDGVFSGAAAFLLRIYVEKQDPRFKPALDKALRFVLESQYPIGAWPQRYPPTDGFSKEGRPDYSSYLTFNDDVAAGNIDFLLLWYQAFGDKQVLDAVIRGMNAFLVTQVGPPQSGWALQYTPDLKPAGARSYEPKALATHTTAACIDQLFRFYTLTGETKFLARIPQAIEWLDACALPSGERQGDRTHPTFLELGTNRPLYIHRTGSNVANGRYLVDYEPGHTVGHYGSFRRIDTERLKQTYARLVATPPDQACKDSPLLRPERRPLPRFVSMAREVSGIYAFEGEGEESIDRVIRGLNSEGYWPVPLRMTSHPYLRDSDSAARAGDFSKQLAGDETDTSPYRDPNPAMGVSTAVYIRNMCTLMRALRGD